MNNGLSRSPIYQGILHLNRLKYHFNSLSRLLLFPRCKEFRFPPQIITKNFLESDSEKYFRGDKLEINLDFFKRKINT